MSARIVLLCEDRQLATFLRRFLKRRGWQAREIREEIAPPGQGSGEQWVRQRYPRELQAARWRKQVLVVGTDADTMTVAERIETLDKECQEQHVPKRTASDPVVMVVPKRSIETWFAYLRGEDPNENTLYPRYPNEADCRHDVKALDEMCRAKKLRSPVPPSLAAACREYQKLPSHSQ